jgi:hypothetical protein
MPDDDYGTTMDGTPVHGDSQSTSAQLRNAQERLSNAIQCFDDLQSIAGRKYQEFEAQLAEAIRERDDARAAGAAYQRLARAQRRILDRIAAHLTTTIDPEPPAHEKLPEIVAKLRARSQAYLLRADHLADVAQKLVNIAYAHLHGDDIATADPLAAAVDTMCDVLSRDMESYLTEDYDSIGAESRIHFTSAGRSIVASVPRDAREGSESGSAAPVVSELRDS